MVEFRPSRPTYTLLSVGYTVKHARLAYTASDSMLRVALINNRFMLINSTHQYSAGQVNNEIQRPYDYANELGWKPRPAP